MKKAKLLFFLCSLAPLGAHAGEPFVALDVSNSRISDVGSSTGLGISAGYNFNKNFALEGGYKNMGSSDTFINSVKVTSKSSAWQASVVGSYFFGDKLGLFARLGVNSVNIDANTSTASAGTRGSGLLVGAGLILAMNENFALRAEVQRPNSGTTTISLGGKLSF